MNNSRTSTNNNKNIRYSASSTMPNNQRRNVNNNTNKKHSFRVLRFTFLLAIIIVCAYVLFTDTKFNLTDIKVKGNTKYSEDEIIQSSNLKIGKNVFKQLLSSKNRQINLSYIAKVNLSYSIPSTITIKVKERYPEYIAKDKDSGKYYIIDNDGYILEETNETKDLLIIEGFSLGDATYGKRIDEVYLKKLDIYNEIKETLEKYEISGKITKVEFATSLTTVTLDDKLNIVFANNSNFEYKVSFLKEIIKQNGGQMEGRIDMSVDKPVYSKYN